MQISVRRSGGFAGITEAKTVDTARLDASAAQSVEQLVRDLDFFALPVDAAAGGVGADLLQNEISVRDGSQQRTIRFNDEGQAETASLRRLLDTVLQMG